MPPTPDHDRDAFLRLTREFHRLRWISYVAWPAALVTVFALGWLVGAAVCWWRLG
jgi:hypothetical protein